MPGYLNRYTLSRVLRFRKNKDLVEELMKMNPDVIFYNTSVTSLIAKDVPNEVKNICIVRETFVKSHLNFIIRRNFEKKFKGVAYIAEHEKEYINLINPEQIIIPDCLEPRDVEIYNQIELKNKYGVGNKFCSLFMGGMVQIKGLDVALKAAEILDENHCLLVAGNVNMELLKTKYILRHVYNVGYVRFLISVRKRLDKLIREKKVILLGYSNNISEAMNLCDTVIFPSTAAHQPRPCIEAGEYKKSVILSDYEATKEYFVNGLNALVFKPKSSKELSKKIKYLFENNEYNKELGNNNFTMTREKHNYIEVQEQLNKFFDKLLK
jgi:glycosyltransferase involved in cell wall biosynthesis